MTERKLATIRIINRIDPIEGADKIECATVDGWKSVIGKNEYKCGDKIVYCEIDAFVPSDLAPSLSKGKEPKVYLGIKGERLKTSKIRGQISQGLILSLPEIFKDLEVGTDITDEMGIKKYENVEASEKVTSNMTIKGNFPIFIEKTKQDRIQNIFNKIIPRWEITEKLDGSSMTVYYKEGEIGVCSHNLDIAEDDKNSFWKVAKNDGLIEKLTNFKRNIALQGELIGEKIQNNRYKIKGQTFYLFDIFDIDRHRYLTPHERWTISEELSIKHVPIINKGFVINENIDEILKNAEQKSKLCADAEQEGYVYKRQDGSLSFKVISNKYLLKE